MECRCLYVDNIKINFAYRTVEIDGEAIDITSREFDVFEFLLGNMNKIVSRRAIQRAVWGREFDASSRTVETHISRIRLKLRLYADKNMRIISAYAIGYRLVVFGATMVSGDLDHSFPVTGSQPQRAVAEFSPAGRT
ncbi:transcriptional regulator [Burkholderia sp. Nafp2/4-1b]|uniref:winged helix-turn-helix domain-containing protein n=1 Tax=Burkholderia sp. Nafp2/4-1b TaxID=2116686 RepID=UPI000EF8AB7C|nr:winged helix-turn-helix domain-containing protein [Burkholderia sp. Nafp2/4-1b]RKT98663.1 transcriptional regulator [Burkholderia sp. Nafp2/4-1b]